MRWTSSSPLIFMLRQNRDRRQPRYSLEPWLLPWHSFVSHQRAPTHGGTLVSSPIYTIATKGCPLKKKWISIIVAWLRYWKRWSIYKDPPWWKSGSGIRSSLFELSCKWLCHGWSEE
jgi:hypothetical protein